MDNRPKIQCYGVLFPLFVVLNCAGIPLESSHGLHASKSAGGGAALAGGAANRTKPPPMYKVLLAERTISTPNGFRRGSAEKYFGLSREQSTQVMLKVHREGRGVLRSCIPTTWLLQGRTGERICTPAPAPWLACGGK